MLGTFVVVGLGLKKWGEYSFSKGETLKLAITVEHDKGFGVNAYGFLARGFYRGSECSGVSRNWFAQNDLCMSNKNLPVLTSNSLNIDL